MSLVTVIIPNYNHEQYLQQRIESVLSQTFQDFELIILDDCSTDNSKEIIKQYSQHPKVSHIIFNDRNSGSTFKQWVKGLELAKTEFIWIAESDDYCDKYFLEKCMHQLDQDKSIGLAYCSSYLEINNTRFVPNHIEPVNTVIKGNTAITDFMIFNNFIPNASAVVFKKRLIDDALIYQSLGKFKWCGDWFLWIKLMKKSNIIFIAEKLNYIRRHNNNVTNKYIELAYDFVEIFPLLIKEIKKSEIKKNTYKKFRQQWMLKLRYRYLEQTKRKLIIFRPFHYFIHVHLAILIRFIYTRFKKLININPLS